MHRFSLGILFAALTSPAALARTASVASNDAALDLPGHVPARVVVDGGVGRATRVDVDLGTSRLTLDLQPRSLRHAGYQVLTVDPSGQVIELDAPTSRTFRGQVAGDPGSVVAASLLSDGLHARVRTSGGQDVWIEPADVLGVPGLTGHIAYEHDDHPSHGTCATIGEGFSAAPHQPTAAGADEGTDVLEVAELAIDADFQYFQRYGTYTAAIDRIETVINAMNVQYETEVEITHLITAIVVRIFPTQPYTTTNPSGLLNQFANEWSTSFSGIVRDVAQLFTGRNVAGGVIGIAFLGSVCTGSGYSMVQSDFVNFFACATDLSAHELGHTWGAGHCNCPNNTMNASITCTNDFANVSVNAITNFKNSRPCLSGSVCVPPFVVSRNAPGNVQAYTAQPVVIGQPTIFTVDTNGFQTASIFGVAAPAFRPLDGGVALINPESGSYFALGPLPGPIAQASVVVTSDPSLCGVTIYSQALLRNGPGAFIVTNAQDLRVGM